MTGVGLSTHAGIKILLAVTVGTCVSVGILAWRERPEPGSVPLTALMAGVCWWAAALFFRLDATGVREKTLWFDAGWLGIVLIPVAWVLFSVEYTGNSQYITRKRVILLSIIPAVSAVVGLTNSYHSLMYTDSMLIESHNILMLDRVPGAWFWVITVYTLSLGLLGTLPLLDFVTSDVEQFRGQSFAILFGALAPVLTNTLFLLGGLPTGGVDPTPVSFCISGVAFLGALTRFRLFTTTPAPIRPAQKTVFQRMQEGAIVLDRDNNIIDLNTEATTVLGAPPEELLGESLQSLVPEIAPLLDSSSEPERMSIRSEHRTYDVSLNRITDTHGRLIGQIVTLHDITEHVRQQQRLEVLNRVFRHNIRTNTQVIMGYADYLATTNSPSKAQKVQQKAQEIEQVSDDIRTVLHIFERGQAQPRPVSLRNILTECLTVVREEYPDVLVECEFDSDDHYVDSVLDDVLLNVVENAAQHNTSSDPKMWINVTAENDHVRITVEDNGPGIDEEELSLIKNRTETPLEHGTGFGLAIAMWGTESADGEITFEERDPTGLRVTVEVPPLYPDDIEHEEVDSPGLDSDTFSGDQLWEGLS
jgi:PAS domain S-box-containing protein